MEKVTDFFGCNVFDDRIMKATLSEKVIEELLKEGVAEGSVVITESEIETDKTFEI